MSMGACTSVFSRLSANSSNHSGRSRKQSSASRLPSHFFFCLVLLRVIRTSLVGLVRHFAFELDLLTNPSMPMLATNWSQNWWITLERTRGTKLFVLHTIAFLSLVNRGFRPLAHSKEYPWSSQLFSKRKNSGRFFEWLHSHEQI